MKTGQIVMFKEPVEAGEDTQRMRVLENAAEERVLVQEFVPGMTLQPVRTLRTDDLVVVEPNAAELRMALEATLEVLLQCNAPSRLKQHTLNIVETVRGMLSPVAPR